MRRRLPYAPRPFGDVNVTPLIDVVMVMIVFYLIVGKLAEARDVPMRLPEARGGSSDRPLRMLTISVTATEVIVDRAPVATRLLDALIRERLAARADTVVQVRAARDLPYAVVQPVIDACRRAGVASVRLATEHVP
ncbi:MAG: biopolymer transporter ExbD [Phycisphaerales bacterium]|nr:biopolymer transporter ExbD [Phycisphaerales bacterium]